MKVILLRDIPALGRKNEVKEVSGGYARNFLLPQKFAEPATDAALATLAAKKTREERQKTEEENRYRDAAEKLKDTTLSFKLKMGERGKAFGSVTAQKIADGLKKQGMTVEKDWIMQDESIKAAGEHGVIIRFPHGISAQVKIVVEPE